ncbi:NmrA-like family protein [Microdochium trichocladiopsis]|uniref:NmrA-like family protein n=1 Tax=Microdochium trichocladiopsis TaxID=1682393 RepID=A0A9P8XZH7_9PEZI|nr:NmrA-like family protein [Microdochium trichocladiopsis]KAH7025716.1 NmrA-like family protein [Microdochium trichocladiopsis]
MASSTSSSAAVPGNVLIIGATGVIGQYITSAIISSGVAAKVTIFTSPSTAAAAPGTPKHKLLSEWKSTGKVHVVTGDVNNADDIRAAYRGQNTVVSALGRDSLLSQIELLRIAEEDQDSSVQWFLPSEYGTDIEYDAVKSPHEKPHQNKLKVRAFVRDHIKRLKVTYVVTGPYLDMFLALSPVPEAQANGGYDVAGKRAVVVGDGEGKVGFTSMPDVGKFVVAALRHPEAAYGKALKVQSLVTTPNAILQEFEKQTSSKWQVEHTPLDKLRQLEEQSWQAGKPYATGFTLRRIWGEGGTLYEKTDNESLGVKDEDLESLSTIVGRAVRGEGW